MKFNAKKAIKAAAGIGSIILSAGALILSKKSGEIHDDEDRLKLEPLGGDDDYAFWEECVEADETEQEEPEEEVSEDE